jgi:nucleoside-diphosphate-sugar epimerase
MPSNPKTVLVTGANGYLASAVILHFLEHGYNVRGTVRSLSKTEGLKGYLYPKYQSSLSFVVIEDMTKDGAYEQAGALDGVDAVCHVASPVPDLAALSPPDGTKDIDWVRDMVQPAIQGTLTILRAASKFPRVTHVNIMSSSAAVIGLAVRSDQTAPGCITEADWNSAKAEDADNKLNAWAAYFASKAEAERAAWSYVEETKPHYTIATFCAPFFFGPAAVKAKTPQDFGSSLGVFYRLMIGEIPLFDLNGSFIDVRDIGKAFRLVIEKPLTEHGRFLLTGGAHTADELVAFAKTLDPSVLEDRASKFNTKKAREVLGWTPRPKKETFVDMAAYLKEAEKGFSN